MGQKFLLVEGQNKLIQEVINQQIAFSANMESLALQLIIEIIRRLDPNFLLYCKFLCIISSLEERVE